MITRFRKGERIEVVGLIDDPDPIPIGTTGTVENHTNVGTSVEQVWVKWDQGQDGRARTLVLIPADYSCVRKLPWATASR